MSANDVGSYYQDVRGDLWKLIAYADQPTATLERLDPFEMAREEGRTRTRASGVVGSLIFEGFRKLVPEEPT